MRSSTLTKCAFIEPRRRVRNASTLGFLFNQLFPGRGGEIVPVPRRLLHQLFVNLAGDAIGCDRAVVEGYFGNSIIVAAVAVEE